MMWRTWLKSGFEFSTKTASAALFGILLLIAFAFTAPMASQEYFGFFRSEEHTSELQSPEAIAKATRAMLDDAYANGEKTGYVANLGHGITQWVDPERPKVFIDTVHEYSAKYL